MLMTVVPIVGLSVASAPGFAHYLGFLKPFAQSNGVGSGVIEGLVPALVLIMATSLAVYAVNRAFPVTPGLTCRPGKTSQDRFSNPPTGASCQSHILSLGESHRSSLG